MRHAIFNSTKKFKVSLVKIYLDVFVLWEEVESTPLQYNFSSVVHLNVMVLNHHICFGYLCAR